MTKFLVALQVLCLVFGHPEKCSDHICGMYCKFGFERDEKGCEICKCKEELCNVKCSGKLCKMYCHLGFERDENGCEICKCKQELCNVSQSKLNE
uniref:Antistasin-like factor C n=1 Tax=Hirudo verbana TaxID=311461 RepID=A0A7T0KCN5_9ANNE|nr:antistasin-like factor C [Hirudo verbana]